MVKRQCQCNECRAAREEDAVRVLAEATARAKRETGKTDADFAAQIAAQIAEATTKARALTASELVARQATYRATAKPPVPPPPPEPEKLGPPVGFAGPLGFGDNINLRPIIKHLARKREAVYLSTTIPELFWDIPRVRFVRPTNNSLRTQKKHLELTEARFVTIPKGTTLMGWHREPQYTPCDWRLEPDGINRRQFDFPGEEVTVSECIRRRAGIPREEFDFTLPVREAWIEEARKVIAGLGLKDKKLCLVRPNTLRKEWFCPTRNPKTEHYQTLIDFYGDEYFFLSVADLEPEKEWLEEKLRGVDKEFHRGELPWTTIFGLIKLSDMFLTNPGWGMLAGIAIRAKTFTIFGGELAPRYFIDKQIGDDNVGWVAPEPFCNCFKMEHDCNKDIPRGRVVGAFEELRSRPLKRKVVTVGFAPGMGDANWALTKMRSFREKEAIDTLRVSVYNEHAYPFEFLRHVPLVDEVVKAKAPFPFRMSLAGGDGTPLIRDVGGVDCIIDFGSRLEAGIKLEDILPEYDTEWDYQINGLDEHAGYIERLRKKTGGRLVVFYTASVGSHRNWARGDWGVGEWVELARLIKRKNGCPVVLVGAAFDRDMAEAVTENGNGPLFIDLVGQTSIMLSLAIVRAADLLIGFSAGLAIMGAQSGRPSAIFWPVRGVSEYPLYNPKFMRSWVSPAAKDKYFGFAYGAKETTPAGVFAAVGKFIGGGAR